MSTNLPHYNDLFKQPWYDQDYTVVYQPSCLVDGYDQNCWPIQFPTVDWTDNTVVIMHCQDFVSIKNNSCPELELIQQHFGARSNQVVVVHWNYQLEKVYNGPLRLVHFPTHSYELLNNLQNDKSTWIDNFNYHRPTIWQCLNGVPRAHRKLVADYCNENLSNGVLSLAEEITLPEWSYGNYIGCENETNWQKLQYVYTQCQINIVTETQYTECPGIISEKTLMAFLAQQVPIIIGYKGMVEHCRQLGFDMFDDVVNHSYDNEPDDRRWYAALTSNKHLLDHGLDLSQYQDRLIYNLDHALNFPQRMIEHYLYWAKNVSMSG